MQRTVSFVLPFILTALLIGCSGESEKSISGKDQKTVENIMEKAIQDSSGEKVDVDIADDKIHIKSEEGDVIIANGKNMVIPENFPKDIPIYKNADIIHSLYADQDNAFNLSFTVGDDQKKVTDYYKQIMLPGGWESIGNVDMPNRSLQTYSKGDRTANIMISPGENGTQVTITAAEEKE